VHKNDTVEVGKHKLPFKSWVFIEAGFYKGHNGYIVERGDRTDYGYYYKVAISSCTIGYDGHVDITDWIYGGSLMTYPCWIEENNND